MAEASSVDTVVRALADSTRRAVFERIVSSDERTVVELTPRSGVTQGAAVSQHLRSLKQAGLIGEHPAGRNVTTAPGPGGLDGWSIGEPLQRLLAQAVPNLSNPLKEIDP